MKKKLPLIARLLLGLPFVVFGMNGFLHFIPMQPMPEPAQTFFTGLMAVKYFLPVLAGTEVFCGLCLVTGAFVPLALIVLAPVMVQIILFHLFVSLEGMGMVVFFAALQIYLSFFAEPYASIVKQIFRCPMKEAMDQKKANA